MAALCAFLALFVASAGVGAQTATGASPLVCSGPSCPHPAEVNFDPSWVQLSPSTSPSGRQGAAIAYDAAHGVVVLFGGYAGAGGVLGDTWTWNGVTWTQQNPPTSPSARWGASMTYDANLGGIVLFGGGNIGPTAETWTWNGSAWTELSPSTSPPARYLAAMAYDAASGKTILFGGDGASENLLGDTWAWNGISESWMQLNPSASPSARYGSGIAYDPMQGQLVLFGGAAPSDEDDTWTWDGSTWSKPGMTSSPAERFAPAMAYSGSLGQVVMFGGYVDNSEWDDTQTWNGTDWTFQPLLTSPSQRGESAMAYDAAQGQVVLFGGGNNTTYFGDTWTLEIGSVDLGTANVCPPGQTEPAPCSQSATLNFTVSNGVNANGTVSSIAYLTGGVPNLDFQQSATAGTCTATAYTTTVNCTVNVTFIPTVAGERTGAVVFYYNNEVLASLQLSGTGVGPQVVYGPNTQTVLGGGFSTPEGAAVDGAGNVYVADLGNSAVKEIPAGCTSSSCVTEPGAGFVFVGPTGIAVDGGGNLYVSDSTGNAVNEIPAGCTSSGCVTPLGGGFNNPLGVALDTAGNVYVVDNGTATVKEMPPGCATTACVQTLIGGLARPQDVAVDGSGNVFVTDQEYDAVFKVPPGCTSATSSCGTRLGDAYNNPLGVAVDAAGNVYVADSGNHAVKVIPAGCASESCSTTTLASGFSTPNGVALDSGGNVYVSDSGTSAVKELNRSTAPTLAFDTTEEGKTSADSPRTATIENIGNQPLDIFSVSYPKDFPEAPGESGDCAASSRVPAGGVCTMTIDFSPQLSSLNGISTLLSESVSLNDNNLNASSVKQSVSVKGTETGIAPSLTSPTASPLAGSTKFTWSPGAGSSMFALWIGTSPGTFNIYTSGHVAGSVTSETVSIPANGAKLYVQLWYEMGTTWSFTSYTFTEALAPSLTSPSASPISGSTKFTWSAGTGSTMFALWIGTSPGTLNVYTSGHVANTVTSETVTIPENGATLYVSLWYEINGAWASKSYTFTEAASPNLTSPTSSPLSGSTKFTWSPGNVGASMFALWVGTSPGTSNIYTSGHVANTVTSETVSIPANGATIYVTLWYELNGDWLSKSYTFTEAS